MSDSSYADLRARLAPLAAAAMELVSELDQIAARENGLLADTDRVAVFRETLLGASKITTDLRAAVDALLARAEAAEADAVRLTVILRTPYPVGAYVRWSRNGNTEDADALNHYEEDREAALRLHDEAIALWDPS